MCDVRVYTRKILWLSVFSFPPSWIWAIGVSSHSQSHELQKWRPRSKRPCFALNGQNNLWGRFDEVKHCKEILKSYKIVCHSKNLLDVFIHKLPSKIYKMCSISGIKRHPKKLSSLCQILAGNFLLLNGPLPEFARSAKSSRRSLETRDWCKFSPFMRREYKKCTSGKKHRFFIFYWSDKKFINVKASGAWCGHVLSVFFCKWTRTCVWSIDACLVSCFHGSQQCCQFVLYLPIANWF